MFWDCSWVQNNVINGKHYSEYAFKLVSGGSTVPPTATTSPPTPPPRTTLSTSNPTPQPKTTLPTARPTTAGPPTGRVECIRDVHNHGQNVRARHQSEAQLPQQAIRSCKHGGQYGRSECRWKKARETARLLRCTARISYAKFSQILEVLRDFHRLFGTRNSPTTGILLIIDHVYRSVWPAREAKPRFGAALVRSAHDCSLIVSLLVICSAKVSTLACLVIISSYLPIVSTNCKIYHSQRVLC